MDSRRSGNVSSMPRYKRLERYVELVMEPYGVVLWEKISFSWMIMYIHIIWGEFFETEDIKILEWPACLSALNPIECLSVCEICLEKKLGLMCPKAENSLADFKLYGIDNKTFFQKLKVIGKKVSKCSN